MFPEGLSGKMMVEWYRLRLCRWLLVMDLGHKPSAFVSDGRKQETLGHKRNCGS